VPHRSMLQPESSPGLRGQGPWFGLLPVLLAFLGIACAEVQPPQSPEQTPMPGGKGHLGEDRGGGAIVSSAEGTPGDFWKLGPRPEPCVVLM
jgi:hypothetical protein